MQEIEATLHCLTCIQEALDYTQTPQLGRIFSPEIMGQLPSTGRSRTRRTTLSLIGTFSINLPIFTAKTTTAESIMRTGTYSSWFAMQEGPTTQQQLMTAVGYAVAALPDPVLCLQAGSALRNLCDSNRKALAPQISAFAELHAGIGQIPVSFFFAFSAKRD